jgi:hypothetical protein|tara:strand:- start:731 stop:922 length:192 start_codon:yes stop_codon:yes gene_type:complete
MKAWSTPKAIKSKKMIDKGLKKLGKSLGLDKPFSAAITFDDTKGIWKICPCCGGDALLDGFGI